MSSSLTWLDHDAAARDRSLRILALFREKETRDELGIGGVRDAIADRLFPGTSTIQTRLRYMLLVPWIYLDLERQRVPAGSFAARARQALLPLSNDAEHLTRLKRGLALYRLVFGQPRQEDLLAHIGERLSSAEVERAVAEWRIDLSP